MVGPKRDAGTLENIRMLADVSYVRDGRHRLPTAKKQKVVALVTSSEDRRRLGKQQQLLNDIARRCREQEVQDLTGGLTRKVHFTSGEDRAARDFSFYASQQPAARLNSSLSRASSTGIKSPSLSVERGNTMFPLRSPIKSPVRGFFSLNLPRLPQSTQNTARDRIITKESNALSKSHPTFRPAMSLPSIRYLGIKNKLQLESYMKAKALPIEDKSKSPSSLDQYNNSGMGKVGEVKVLLEFCPPCSLVQIELHFTFCI